MVKVKKPTKNTSALGKTKTPACFATAQLLLEIGVEELPYQFIQPALDSMKDSAEMLLKEQRLRFQTVKILGTPRRLVLVVEGLIAHQAGTVKETMGPSKSVAFDQTGQPTRAALGFAAGQGIAVTDLQVRQTPKGEYVFAVKREEGRPTKTVLVDLLPQLVAKLSFPKAMKWNETGIRFARPIRWLVALYGGQVLPIDIAGLEAGSRTWGHRVHGGGKGITIRDFESYNEALERHGVIPDQDRRRKMIEEQIAALCKKTGFRLILDDELLQQAVFTTEYPCSIIGSFKDTYLEVPEEILITSMKEHQGFFSLMNRETSKLAPHFIAVVNTQLKDMSLVREGNERVLAARLADAKFFYDEDRKLRLEERAKKLSQVTFHQKLGTMAQKQERVAKLIGVIAELVGERNDKVILICTRAATLCKADLLSGIVGEFPTLQGIMGGYYARHDKEDSEVADAISEHYLPRAMEGPIPQARVSQMLSIADRLDSIAAFFHVGMIPSGSEDPFALRRHATAIVRIILEAKFDLDLGKLIERAQGIITESGIKAAPGVDVHRRIVEFFFERVRHYGRTTNSFRDDVINAVLNAANKRSFDLLDLFTKMKALQSVTARKDFDPLMIGFKRAHRLIEKEQWDKKAVESAMFQHPAESELSSTIDGLRQNMKERMKVGNYGQALDSLVALKPAIDAFFEAVMVNADDVAVRSNRLSLLKEVDDIFMSFADFSQIVVQGS